jgi:hypothetical protein
LLALTIFLSFLLYYYIFAQEDCFIFLLAPHID